MFAAARKQQGVGLKKSEIVGMGVIAALGVASLVMVGMGIISI